MNLPSDQSSVETVDPGDRDRSGYVEVKRYDGRRKLAAIELPGRHQTPVADRPRDGRFANKEHGD